MTPLYEKADSVFTAPGGKILLADESKLIVYDPVSRKALASVENVYSKIKQAVWYNNLLALVGRRNIYLLTKNLSPLVTIEERLKIKSLFWLG